MTNQITKWLSDNKKAVSIALAVLALLFAIAICCSQFMSTRSKTDKIEYSDSSNTYHSQYKDGKFSDLKKENKELYDSLKKYKDQIDFLLQFDYDKSYKTGKVETKTVIKEVPVYIKDEKGNYVEYNEEARTYEYRSEPNDTLDYELRINSTREPKWYELNVRTHDRITVVNKDQGNGDNHLTIKSDGKGDISDVTTFKRKKKTNIFNKIAIGPTIGYGYTTGNGKFGPYIGIGVTYNIFGTK